VVFRSPASSRNEDRRQVFPSGDDPARAAHSPRSLHPGCLNQRKPGACQPVVSVDLVPLSRLVTRLGRRAGSIDVREVGHASS
jgi:hypothetical protein